MMYKFRILYVFALLIVAGCAGSKAPVTPQQEAKTLYDEAARLQDAEAYDEAGAQFEEYVRKYPESDSADNAKLKIGDGLFQQGKYEEAIKAYQDILDNYPGGDSADQALLSMGDVYFAQQKNDEAVKTYEKLLTKYVLVSKDVADRAQVRIDSIENIAEDMQIIKEGPDEEKDNAQYDIADTYFTVFGDYARAKEEFQKLVDQWPKSELADDALWEVGECHWSIATQTLPSKDFSEEQLAYMDLIETIDRYPQLARLDLFRLDAHWPAGKRGDNYELAYAEVRRIVNKYPGLKEKKTADLLPENYRKAFEIWQNVIYTYPNTDTAVQAPGRIALAFVNLGNLYNNMGLRDFSFLLFRESLMAMPTPEGHLGMARYYAKITSVSGTPWAYRRAFYHIKKAEELTTPGSRMASAVGWAKEWMNYKMRIESLESRPDKR